VSSCGISEHSQTGRRLNRRTVTGRGDGDGRQEVGDWVTLSGGGNHRGSFQFKTQFGHPLVIYSTTDYVGYMCLRGKPHEGRARIIKDLRGWEGGKWSGGQGRP